MELIIFIIIIAVVLSNSKTRQGNSEKKTSSVWDMVDSGAKFDEIAKGIHNLEDNVNKLLRNNNIQRGKQKKASEYEKEQQARRKKEEDARRIRDYEERQKRKLELQKKQEEQRKKQLEKERKAREEKELLARCSGTTNHSAVETHKTSESVVIARESTAEISNKKISAAMENKPLFRTEEYLDPLTSSFYPDVEDYLFPTIAPFYPNVDLGSFSLQNPTDVI